MLLTKNLAAGKLPRSGFVHMEISPVIKLNEIIADTIWSSPRYHGGAYECKIWLVVIIFKHRQNLRGLITALLLESSAILKELINFRYTSGIHTFEILSQTTVC